MDLVAIIEEKYDLKDVQWLEKPQLIMTHLGKRKLSYWRDRDLLEYHLNFRDRLFSQHGFLCNRMIRTNEGKRFIRIENDYMTVHDHVEEAYPLENVPEMKGYLLATLLSTGDQKATLTSHFPYRKTLEDLSSLRLTHKEQYLLLVNLIPEVKKRLDFEICYSLPFIPFTHHVLKEVLGQIYFECSDEPPVSASKVILKEVHSWYALKNSPHFIKCFEALVNGVEDDMKPRLIQVIFAPWEWQECIQALQSNMNDPDQVMKEFIDKWEANRDMLRLLELSLSDRRISF
ncbi:hypothetical protein [Anaerobacillus sp. 1_MG-2023]|uniref:hypothetical protein n=1 Tax=Bacillales TaxID=1385 RepID=UPI0026E2E971|nr:hypothetical protein [Anaerobacillus sp. 1_MG-2023]MDO6656039.1 hypothetical protein [Anaerobacillus sp. 1_MG-2023]